MTDEGKTMRNDARQASADRPAFGAQAEDFGASGQTVVNNEPVMQQRDPNRDRKLREAGEQVTARPRRTDEGDRR